MTLLNIWDTWHTTINGLCQSLYGQIRCNTQANSIFGFYLSVLNSGSIYFNIYFKIQTISIFGVFLTVNLRIFITLIIQKIFWFDRFRYELTNKAYFNIDILQSVNIKLIKRILAYLEFIFGRNFYSLIRKIFESFSIKNQTLSDLVI